MSRISFIFLDVFRPSDLNENALTFLKENLFPENVICLSSRSVTDQKAMENGLVRRGIFANYFLMRPQENFEPSHVLKKDLIQNYMSKNFPEFLLSDCLLISYDFQVAQYITEKLEIPSMLWPKKEIKK